jgi:hypothetical protein
MKKEKRTRKVTVRFTEKEYEKVNNKFKNTTSSQMSHYIRNVLLEKPVVIKYRNESLDIFMEEIILLRQELNAIGNNFNQSVRKLHTLSQISEFRNWLLMNESTKQQLLEKTNLIQQHISQISDKWLQE